MKPSKELVERMRRAINRLPRYPYHTWDRRESGNHQQLIGLADVRAILARFGLAEEDQR